MATSVGDSLPSKYSTRNPRDVCSVMEHVHRAEYKDGWKLGIVPADQGCLSYFAAEAASVFTTAILGSRSAGRPCRSFRYSGLL